MSADRAALLDQSLDILGLSVRARNAMYNMGLRTVRDVIGMTKVQLMQAVNFGEGSLNDVRRKLHEHGLSLLDDNLLPGPTPDDVCRILIEKWLGDLSVFFGPATRATALMTIARVATELADAKEKQFDSWYWLPCERSQIAAAEKLYIKKFKPILNKALVGERRSDA